MRHCFLNLACSHWISNHYHLLPQCVCSTPARTHKHSDHSRPPLTHTLSIAKICMCYLYVLGDVLSLCSWDVCVCVGSWLQPERNQPADEDDSGLKEALLGTVQCFTGVLLPAHHAVVGLRTHRRHVCKERNKIFIYVVYGYNNTVLLFNVYQRTTGFTVSTNY